MIDTHKLKRRDLYLSKLLAFQDTEPVKVITGIRRCGKSSLLKLMVSHLKENGIGDEQIVEMNFESHAFKNMNSDTFYEYVKEKIVADKRMYLFFDEVQRVLSWEDAINSFRVDFNCDISVTGSNAVSRFFNFNGNPYFSRVSVIFMHLKKWGHLRTFWGQLVLCFGMLQGTLHYQRYSLLSQLHCQVSAPM